MIPGRPSFCVANSRMTKKEVTAGRQPWSIQTGRRFCCALGRSGRWPGVQRRGGETGPAQPPTTAPAQRDAAPTQHAPDLLAADIAPRRGQPWNRPARLSEGRRVVQLLQNAFGVGVVSPQLAGPHFIRESGQLLASEARTPLRHPCGPRAQLGGDLQSSTSLAPPTKRSALFQPPGVRSCGRVPSPPTSGVPQH